jgi:hypothetical protein
VVTLGAVGIAVGAEVVRVSAVELERVVGAIGEANSAAGCETRGRPVSEIDLVTSAAVSLNGITGEVGLATGDGSTDSGNSEAVIIWRDAGCDLLALVPDPPRALTGENGGITAGCGTTEVDAGSAGTVS